MSARATRELGGRRSWRLGALLLAGLSPGLAFAQARVELSVDREIAAVGDTVEVTVEISVSGRGGYDDFVPPAMPGFRAAGSAMTSQNIEIINFQVRRREQRVYRAVAEKVGRQQIGPAAIVVAGQRIESKRVAVEITKGGVSPTIPAPKAQMPSSGALTSVFLSASAAPRKVYVGQQLVAVWRLFTQSDVLGYQPTQQPVTDDFWVEELELARRLQFSGQEVQGHQYYAAPVLRKALFPQRAGKLSLGTLAAQIRVLRGFGSRSMVRQSEPIEIDVLPLPTQGQPADFAAQNVGQFEISARLDRARVKAGEAVQLRVLVQGSGNLRQLRVQRLQTIEGAKVYEPKVKDQLRLKEGVSGIKVIEYLVLPRRTGALQVPPVVLDFFDPSAEVYRRVQTRALTIEVTGDLPPAGGRARTPNATRNVLQADIRPPRQPVVLKHTERAQPWSRVTLMLVLLPVVLLSGVSVAERLKMRLSRQTSRSLARAAGRRVQQHLKRAQKLLDSGAADFFGELSSAISEQLAQTLDASVEGMTRSDLAARMRGVGLGEELVETTIAELDNCDFGRFARSAAAPQQRGEALGRTKKLVQRLAKSAVVSEGKNG